jgi:hypothetical protein
MSESHEAMVNTKSEEKKEKRRRKFSRERLKEGQFRKVEMSNSRLNSAIV